MALRQVFVFMLSIAVAASAHPCFDENDLEDAARVKLNNHLSQTGFPMQASDVPIKCPVDLYKTGSDLMGRSISPWAIVERKMPGHFPSTYYEAECLCQGCILPDEDGEPHETTCYNSRPVNQTRIFLKRELCEHSGGERRYHLRRVNVDVTVACICVRPKVVYAE